MKQSRSPAKPRVSNKAAPSAAVVAAIAPSTPSLIELDRLRRAPENVRHIRVDEDVESLAEDITVHGLLTSLIGYEASWPEDADRVFIVGGGRRLQALELLRERGAIAGDFTVPVLIRNVELAVELSLAENLQQRTMSPVDEFHAFKALMDTGRHSPAELAKRFGFTERLVKQRLRLAELAEPILDALANRQITLDTAQAYATVQDKARQEKVFKSHSRIANPAWSHHPHNVRRDLQNNATTTATQLFKFVGAESYEMRGGDYEDDLFSEAGPDRVLRDPSILEAAAKEMIAFQADRLLAELRESDAWAPTISGYVVTADLQLGTYGVAYTAKPTAPAGYRTVDRYDDAPVWRTIRNNGIDVRVVVGIDPEGKLAAWPKLLFVEEDQADAVDPRHAAAARPAETPEQVAARQRAEGVKKFAYRRAVGPFAGTRFEGRAYWPDGWRAEPEKTAVDGVPGWLVPVRIFVTDAEVVAARSGAEQDYDDDLAAQARAKEAQAEREREADEAARRRSAELTAMDPPAVAVIDGEAWFRAEDESYAPAYNEDATVGSWAELLEHYDADDIASTFETRTAFDQAMADAGAAPIAEAAE
ncbi:ParB/RepB/Spo0J family partition protein [Sphingomonas sp. BK580]|uniref:ParB/RepB/Spo0J family partition protein n=1 Tax=Sphingomonas sp. BK580 TaxID=2586972 RepID=UPI001613A455|nr:ParB/RepB/Spo0J family partition protein [Sphingomonas sp. BK580]MBB3691488.1 ParB/RepB/Spo0J family partition protein [Sphingomonas sp. BK580]